MAKLSEIVEHPNFDSAASGAAKTTIFVFVATFGYLVFLSGVSPGLIGGAAFFVIGIFAASLLIAAPLFYLRVKLPRLAPLVSIADLAITILVTRAVYLWLFASPPVSSGPAVGAEPFVVECSEPLPEFTLGLDSHPSKAQVTNLCTCVWSRLGSWEKDAARALSQGRDDEVSSLNKAAFPSRFGDAIRACGGMDL
jgi:hypothetical protein